MSSQNKIDNLADLFKNLNSQFPNVQNTSNQTSEKCGSNSSKNNLKDFVPILTSLFSDIATTVPYEKSFVFNFPNDNESKQYNHGIKTNEICKNIRCLAFETDNTFVVNFCLPGLEKKDIKVTVKDFLLTVEANFQNSLPLNVQINNYSINDFEFGKLKRTIKLPITIDDNAPVETSLVNGVLQLIFSKTAAAQPKEIPL